MIYLLHTPQDCPVIATEYCLVLNFLMFHSISITFVKYHNCTIYYYIRLNMKLYMRLYITTKSLILFTSSDEFRKNWETMVFLSFLFCQKKEKYHFILTLIVNYTYKFKLYHLLLHINLLIVDMKSHHFQYLQQSNRQK